MNKEEVIMALMNAADNCITESDLRDRFEQIILSNHFDYPKVKLPRKVGEEIKDYQDEGIDILGYLHDVIDSKKLRTTRVWMLGNREQHIGILADAYRYGWEAEPESKWYVKAPESWKGSNNKYGWLYKLPNGEIDTCNHREGFAVDTVEQFTRAEIKHYHFDSDIFTLVPVENEEVSR